MGRGVAVGLLAGFHHGVQILFMPAERFLAAIDRLSGRVFQVLAAALHVISALVSFLI